MIVVADSGPLNYLILLEQVSLLHRLYGAVLVPDAVAAELSAAGAPQSVRKWMSQPPPWIEVVEVTSNEMASVAEGLDRGERAAIALAERVRAELLLIDESEGRIVAAQLSLRVTGTLGVLLVAAGVGLIDVRDVLSRLAATNFYVDEELLKTVFRDWLSK